MSEFMDVNNSKQNCDKSDDTASCDYNHGIQPICDLLPSQSLQDDLPDLPYVFPESIFDWTPYPSTSHWNLGSFTQTANNSSFSYSRSQEPLPNMEENVTSHEMSTYLRPANFDSYAEPLSNWSVMELELEPPSHTETSTYRKVITDSDCGHNNFPGNESTSNSFISESIPQQHLGKELFSTPVEVSAESSSFNHDSLSVLDSTLQEIQQLSVNELVTMDESTAVLYERTTRQAESKTDQKRRLNLEKKIAKHSVKEGCLCNKQCSQKISNDRRLIINKYFCELDHIGQKLYIRSQSSSTTSSNQNSTRRKVDYFLNDEMNEKVPVCQKFFLATLGFNANNNTVVRLALNNEFPSADGRGKHSNHPKFDESMVVNHIMSFHPESSHHRREHAPHRLYLPSDVTIVKMHIFFNESNPAKTCGYDYYRKVVEKLNISFTKLGHEQCEQCEKYDIHKETHSKEHESDCEICIDQKYHKESYDKARIEYEKDKLLPFDPKVVIVSGDLQKIVMLPRMEQFKEVLFTKRICVFNQTFAPLGGSKNIPVFPCVWHEGIAGRKKEEIISCYHSFLQKHRDAKEIIIWSDNCTSQNKCWALFSFLTYIVNSTEISADSITMKYLEKGHTYMSADSFHHQVELTMKNRKKSSVCDFTDFVDCVQNANSGRVLCKEINFFDFADWCDWSSITKINKNNPRPYVKDFAKLMFLRGKKSMFYANNLDDDFCELDFIMSKYLSLPRPSPRLAPTGISDEVKDAIITKLTPLMPANRRHFWYNLHSTA